MKTKKEKTKKIKIIKNIIRNIIKNIKINYKSSDRRNFL